MIEILPAGTHNGTILQSWASAGLFVCRITYPAASAYAEHGNERATIITVEQGRCLKQTENERLSLSTGSILFIPSRCIQADSFPVATTFVAAELSTSLVERVNANCNSGFSGVPVVGGDACDFQLRMRRELTEPDDLSELVFECLLLNVLVCAQRTHTRTKQPPAWLAQARDLLNDRAFQPIKLREIAESVGVHPSQLCREFRRFFHLTPGDYTRQVRLERAKELLQRGDGRLVDIAVRTGFADQAHFSRVFRRQTGYSPGHYRQLIRRERS